jgi:hypothetical protein
MYKKTHGNFAPGEQKARDYQWPIDKVTHRFGYGEQIQLHGVSKAIHSERPETGTFPKTVIVKKTVEDVKATQLDLLGKPRNLGQGALPVPEDFAFGIRNTSIIGDEIWNAGKCI